MLIIVLLFSLMTSVYVVIRRRDKLSLYLLGMNCANMIMFAGIIVYIAKIGGLSKDRAQLLFLSAQLQEWLKFRPVSMNAVGFAVAVGRSFFPLFSLFFAMESAMIPWLRRRENVCRIVATVPVLLMIVYYTPAVFRRLTYGNLNLAILMMGMSFLIVVFYIGFSFLIVIWEFQATTISFMKRRYSYVLFTVISLNIIYLVYASKDPTQIYNMFILEYIELGIAMYTVSGLSVFWFRLMIIATFVSVVLGAYGMVRYTEINYTEGRMELELQQRYNMANSYASVFIHSIKNQLLSSKVIERRLKQAIDEEYPDMEKIRDLTVQMDCQLDRMLDRMDTLRKTIKTRKIDLAPIPAVKLGQAAVLLLKEKYPDAKVKERNISERVVLADCKIMSEAIANLMINSYEAAAQNGRDNELSIEYREERLWTVFSVEDNAGGIAKDDQVKIFEPFYTSKNTNNNWGMGLYYVKTIVKKHFGRLRLDSNPGEGSRFMIMLPRVEKGK